MTLKEHAARLIRTIPQDGIVVAIDGFTDNLIVHDGRRGFPVTRHCLEDWEFDRVAVEVNSAVCAMLSGALRGPGGIKFYPLEELNMMRLRPCAFDPVQEVQ